LEGVTSTPDVEVNVETRPEPAAVESDADLVAATLAGDAAAFGRLVGRYQRSAHAACWAVLRDSHLAADAAQEAFLAAYRSLATLRDPAAFGGWLTTIARNRAVRAGRRVARESPLPPTLAGGQCADPGPDADLLRAIAALPEHERAVLTLRYFEHHDVAEIAAVLGRPVGTVTKQLSRAHDRLRRSLAKEGYR